MDSSITIPQSRYVVYMPHNPGAQCHPIRVMEEAEVEDLKTKICEHRAFKAHIGPQDVDLYQCDTLSRDPEDTLFARVTQWLREHDDSTKMTPASDLNQYFPAGPAPKKEKKIDVVVVTDPMLQNIRRPTTPLTSHRAPEPPETPRKTVEETTVLVKGYLRGFDAKLKQYLAGPAWSNFWKAPAPVDERTAQFIQGLQIPQISDKPLLLLHRLGSGVVDPDIVNGLFSGTSKFLVNTSGSGKTRLLFEGLIRHWGFYFTTFVDSVNNGLGSKDMEKIIRLHIPNSAGFVLEPKKLDPLPQAAAFRKNHSIAERRVRQVLNARILVFEHFLKTARDLHRDRPIDEFKEHWLFLQLYSSRILGKDVFEGLSEILTDADDKYLIDVEHGADPHLKKLQNKYHLGTAFFLVLDEAQVALNNLVENFRSEQQEETKRPVLRPIVKTWKAVTDFPIIISGTGLSIDVVNEVITSAVVKTYDFFLATRTGAFDNEERQREYILQYIPPHLAVTDSGKEFLKRAWKYTRGRHRFTAALLEHLLRLSIRSPHKILSAYVEAVCGFVPSDGQLLSKKEPSFDEEMSGIIPLQFSKILNNTERTIFFSDLLYKWLMEQTLVPIPAEFQNLVELGFARFVGSPRDNVLIDEPLVLLAAMQKFNEVPGLSLERYVKNKLRDEIGIGEYFERFFAYYLACAFDGEHNLCDIFDFGPGVPEWAKQSAQLVSIVWNDETMESYPFHLPDLLGATTNIAHKCRLENETMAWFERPSSLMCLPDSNMGPDIVCFVRLATGEILAIIVQCKWRSKGKFLPGDVLKNAIASLDPTEFYNQKNLDHAASRQYILDRFARLNGPSFQADEWFQSEIPVLKAIATYPADASRDELPIGYVSVKMDKCAEVVDRDGFLEAVKSSLKRGPESDTTSKPRKKPRQ